MSKSQENSELLPGLAILNPRGWPTIIDHHGDTLQWYQQRPLKSHKTGPRKNGIKNVFRLHNVSPIGKISGLTGQRDFWVPGTVLRYQGRLAVVITIEWHGYLAVDILGFVTANPHAARGALWAAVAGATRLDTLILGPTGTGKERIANVLYGAFCIANGKGPFVPLNIGALAPTVLTSELFGHERGAFTGAERPNPGAFRCAHNGVLFLDEIGEAAPETQVALLRAIENREVRPLGARTAVHVDILIVSATNQPIEKHQPRAGLRADLLHRLAGAVVNLKPLHARTEDILPIAYRTLSDLGARPEISPEALSVLTSSPWEGNIRELIRVLRQASVLSCGNKIHSDTLLLAIDSLYLPGQHTEMSSLLPLDQEILRIGKLTPSQRRNGWLKLGMAKSTFYRRLRNLKQSQYPSTEHHKVPAPDMRLSPKYS